MSRALPVFETNTQFFGQTNMPHVVSVRPLTVGGVNANFDQILETIAGTIQNAVRREVATFTGYVVFTWLLMV